MFLVVGLGNPGKEYALNRHNLGFMAVRAIHEAYNFPSWKKKFSSEISEASVGDAKVLLLMPQTFMNLSGEAVAAAASFHKIPPEKVIVFHDDIDLLPGKAKVKQGGGHGGHNGLRSIDQHIGNNYWRVRLGVGHPGDKNLVKDYVLNNFAKEDMAWLKPLLNALAAEFPLLLRGETNQYASRINVIKAVDTP